jgi:enoyl-CoA hydratase
MVAILLPPELPILTVERDPSGYAVITLNRPDAMNALSKQLRRELTAAFDSCAADGTRVIIITGAGRAFCAGLDLKELGANGGSKVEVASSEPRSVLDAMAGFKGPIIGAINGAAVTGGFELALACDLMVASTQARFADTHARVGLMPGWGLSQKLSRLIGIVRAKEMSFTGNFIDADTANAWGLVNRVVTPDQLLPTARKLAADMLTTLPHMLTAMKAVIDDGFGMPFEQAITMERGRSLKTNNSIDADEIERRRAGIVHRGQSQQRGA